MPDAAITPPPDTTAVVSRDPQVHSGDLVFAGTRVPVRALLDSLRRGRTVDDFLEGFPSVERWQVEGFFELVAEGRLGQGGVERTARG